MMKSIWKIFILIILTVPVIQAQQVTFQRILPGIDRNMYNMACEPTADGGFFLLNMVEDTDANMVDSLLNISRHDPKGNKTWSVDYTIRDFSFLNDFRFADIENIGDDTLVVTGILPDAVRQMNSQYILKIDPGNGEPLYSGTIKNDNDLFHPAFFSKMLVDPQENINYFSTHADVDSNIWVHTEKLDRNFNSLASKSLGARDGDGNLLFTAFYDAYIGMDSTTVLSCLVGSTPLLDEVGVISMDSSQNLLRADKYRIDNQAYGVFQVFGMAETSDTGKVFVGTYIDLTLYANIPVTFKTDSLGDVQWAYNIGGPSPTSLFLPNDILVTESDEIMITGKSADVFTGDLADLSLFLDNDGNSVRQIQYSSDNSFLIDLATNFILLAGDSKNSPDGTILYSTTGIDLTKGGIFTPLVVKSDRQGAAICHDTIDADMFFSVNMLHDTLLISESAIATRDTLLTDFDEFNDYDIPVLTLLDTVFCPQDPIDVELGTEFEFASSYIWSTGDTTPTIRAMDEGEFMVTVTFDVGVCFELCDTSTINRKEFPEASINVQATADECEFALFATSTTEVALAVWSTGDTINPLLVADEGQYSVTITDACGNTAESSVEYAPADLTVEPSKNNSRRCDEGVIGLRLFEANRTLDTYIWSTGETDPEIFVSEPGTYTVTVTDVCGYTTEATFTVGPNELDFTISPTITLDIDVDDEGDCEPRLIVNPGSPLGGVGEILWSTGESNDTISILSPGTYTVTVSDLCGNSGVATEEVIFDILKFPNIFFPNSPNHDENKIFRPFVACPELFTGQNYQLEVYNRWGNNVFTGNNVNAGWNGNYNGAIAPEGVYVYYATWTDSTGSEQSANGNVTLIR